MVPRADDEELVQRAQQGDGPALDALLRLHYNQIYGICRRLSDSEADALDATQEALITLVRRIDRFDGRAKFTTWMYRVVTNACLDELRRRKRQPTPALLEDEPRISFEPSISESVANRLDIDAALAQLPESFRIPVILCDQLEMSYAEIGEVLDLPPGTVRSRISRGRSRLIELLGGNFMTPSQRHTSEKP